MKYLSFILLLLSLMSCGQNVKEPHKDSVAYLNKVYGKKLLMTDYLKYVDPAEKDSLQKGIAEQFNIYDDNLYRTVHIDAEELAEFNFDFFMPQLNKVLAKRNIKIEVHPTQDHQQSYKVQINNEIIQLYTQHDMDNMTFWDTASRNFFKEVNEIIQKTDTKEKFYLLYGGNDLHVMLLTPEQFTIIAERYRGNIKEAPYLP